MDTQNNLSLEPFFTLSKDMICVANKDGYFVKVNPSFMRVLGYSEEELLKQPFISFVHPDDVENTNMEFKKILDGTPTIYFENRYRTKKGDYKWLVWSSTLAQNGFVYAIAKDITEQKNNVLKLQEYAKELEEMLKRLV